MADQTDLARLVVVLEANADKLDQQIKKSSDLLQQQLGAMEQRAASASKTISSQADAFQAWLAKIDPATRAGQQYAALQDQLNTYVKAGVVSAGDLTTAQAALAAKFEDSGKSTASWAAGLRVAENAMGALGVTFGAAAVVAFVKEVVSGTAELDNQSKVLGVTTDELQAYRAASVLSGAGADAGDAALQRFTRSIGDAEAGIKLQTDAFAALGVSVSDLAGGTGSVLPRAAQGLLDIADASTRARLETDLLGKSGQDVEIVLKQWADPAIVDHMKEMNLVIGEQQVKSIGDADRAWQVLWTHVKIWSAEIVSNAASVANAMAGGLPGDAMSWLARQPRSVANDPILQHAASGENPDNPRVINQKMIDDYDNQYIAAHPTVTVTPNLVQPDADIFAAEDKFQEQVDNLADEVSKRLAEAYQKAWEGAGIASAPSDFALEGRTALDAANRSAQPVQMNRSDILNTGTGTSTLWNDKMLAGMENVSALHDQVLDKQVKIINNAQEWSDRLETIAQERLSQDVLGAENKVVDAFGNLLVQGKYDWKDWSNAAKQAILDIQGELIKLAFINPLKNFLFGGSMGYSPLPSAGGLFSGAAGLGLGNILGGAPSPLAPALVGTPGSGSVDALGNITSNAGGSWLSSLFSGWFADGGTVPPGKWGIAGENGPEPIFGGPSGLSVVPNRGPGGGSQSSRVDVNVSVSSTPELMARVSTMVDGKVTNYDRRVLPSRVSQLVSDPYQR